MIFRLLPRINIDFRGLRTISDVFFMADLILFSTFTPLFLLRLALYPRRHLSLPIIERDSLQFAYLPLWATSFLGLVLFAGFVVAEGRVHPARGWGIAVYVCWWIGMVWAVVTGFSILTVLMSGSSTVKAKTAHGRFAPLLAVLGGVTGVATGALMGAAICLPGVGVRPDQNRIFDDRLAEPVIFFSFCAVGAVLVLTMIVYSVLMHELLLVTGWPPPELTTAIFFFIGPLGQAGAALLFLGDAAGKVVFPPPANYGAEIGGVPTATGSGVSGDDGITPAGGIAIQHKLSPSLATLPLNMIGLVFALLLGGMAITWLILAFINLFHRISRRELYWNSSWNGLVFNIATISITSLWLSLSLESPFFRIAACILLVLSLLTLLGNLVCFGRLVITRRYRFG
ncbi:voltage-dependent anion channel [Cercophora samala]|uniref:Voltage-dependent anion channel n=1 Tax=Cercophora samala TaxID=330535 RepID=A0AA39ZKJ1_9PEZI|nr:voltage-dependent anion channel [Cercophora samala]